MNRQQVVATMRTAMARGRWQDAIKVANHWRGQGGRDWQITLNLAVCLSRSRSAPDQTILALGNEALHQSAGQGIARLGVADLALASGAYEQALQLLAPVSNASLCSNPWPLIELRVQALARLGESGMAERTLAEWPEAQRDWRWRMASADLQVQENNWTAAEVHYREVLKEHPDHVVAHHNLSLTLLSQQRWQEGWEHYEWRGSNPRLKTNHVPELLPKLESLSQKTVVVQGEQGIGDQIMTARYLPTLAAACRKLIVQPDSRLVELFRRSLADHIQVVGKERREATSQDSQLHLGSGSLPLLCWQRLKQGSSAARGYLKPDADRVTRWRKELRRQAPNRQNVGIGWLGGSTGAEHRERSLSAADLQQLTREHQAHWIDLQHLPHGWKQLRNRSQQADLRLLGDPGVDLDESAALIACLDAVITTRQTVAHIAGAINTSGTVLVPCRKEWRYCGQEERWSWYPSLQLMHQKVRGNWREELKEAIKLI